MANRDESDDGSHSSDDESSSPKGAQARREIKETIPDAVDSFLGKLLDALKKRNIKEIHKRYEEDFNTITNNHYRTKKWPSAAAVEKDFPGEELFLIMYKELYYRHLYSRIQLKDIMWSDRKGSWDNYCRLFDLIIEDLNDDSKDPVELSVALPPQWLWDVLDEFVYHYQKYCYERSRLIKKHKTDKASQEIKHFEENPKVWQTTRVLDYLHQLVRYTKIEEYLADKKGGTGYSYSDEGIRYLGYFAIMQLLRMHSLLGDYHLALQTVQHIDIDEEVPLFYTIPACHVTLYYYMGFAYLMMRRYTDAIRTFSDILVFLSKTSGVNSLSYQYEAMRKKQDQMYTLLMIALGLSPRPIDESLEKQISEKSVEQQARLQRGEDLVYQTLFEAAAPKFVSPTPPDFEDLSDFAHDEAHQQQLQPFLQEMRQQQLLPRIGSYMKLYTAIKMSKLAQLCDMEPSALRDQLMCVMHKTSQKVRSKGAPLDGGMQLCSEVEFYLDGDMVHINSQRSEREHADVFLEQILKFQDLLRKMGKASA